MPGGSNGAACVIIACTSWAAASMLRLRSNCRMTCVAPKEFIEFIDDKPAMVENCRSSGVATAEAMVSGLAPGKLAVTRMVGKSTLGRSLTGRARYAATPKMMMASIISVVATGRRMNGWARFM